MLSSVLKSRAGLASFSSRAFSGLSHSRAYGPTAMTLKSSSLSSRSTLKFVNSARFYSSGNEINKDSVVASYGSGSPSVKYTDEHEWVAFHEDGVAFIGITKYAADALGDATFIELAELDAEVSKGDTIGSVESVKSASELYTPVSGVVVGVNEDLAEKPSLVNQDPMGAAWFTKVQVSDAAELEELMDLEAYETFIKSD